MPPLVSEPAAHEFTDCRTFLHEILAGSVRLYAVIDSAANSALACSAWFDHGFETWSLFGDNVDPSMSSVAPRLVAIESGKSGREFLDVWADYLGTNTGILVSSPSDPRTLWEHLAGLFIVSDSNDRLMYFRFYDPRILRALLPTLRGSQIPEVFGPIREFIIDDETPGAIARWRSGREGPVCDRWQVASGERGPSQCSVNASL